MDIFGLAAFIYVCEKIKGTDSTVYTDDHLISRGFEMFLGWLFMIVGVILACVFIFLCFWSNFVILEEPFLFLAFLVFDPFIIFMGWIIFAANKNSKVDKDSVVAE